MSYYYISHHGVKGQKWGVRRYQNYDGTYNAAGEKRYGIGDGKSYHKIKTSNKNLNQSKSQAKSSKQKLSRAGSTPKPVQEVKKTASNVKKANISLTPLSVVKAIKNEYGENYVDSVLDKSIKLSRVQQNSEYEDFGAYYATYKKHDINEYVGLFGNNLKRRYGAEKVYRLELSNPKDIKVASYDSASKVTQKLLQNEKFKDNLDGAIQYSKTQMKRPGQQKVLSQAQYYINTRSPDKLSSKQRRTVYKALNLSLTYHRPDSPELEVQKSFYKEMKKNGYGAIVDINDKYYSSYHAQRPMIIFDTNGTKVSKSTELDDARVAQLNGKYNAERYAKEALYQPISSLFNVASAKSYDHQYKKYESSNGR